mmetsp:Transcript_14597/g.29538  ORF Transcript_14597/g.29538 Transcript_14597/m.29538 type:complete len:183 (-) Transcript_14597:127-675(-)
MKTMSTPAKPRRQSSMHMHHASNGGGLGEGGAAGGGAACEAPCCDADPNQKKSRGILSSLKTLLRNHPIPCFLALLFMFIIFCAVTYLTMEQQYKTITHQKKQAAMKKGWFKSNFGRINKISRDIQKTIDKKHPHLVEDQANHDKKMDTRTVEELPKAPGDVVDSSPAPSPGDKSGSSDAPA